MYSLGLPLNQQWQIKWTFIAISVLKMQSSWRWLACWVGGTPPNFVMTAQPIPPITEAKAQGCSTPLSIVSAFPWAVLSPLPKLWTLPCQKAISLWGVMHRSMPAPQTLYISLPGILLVGQTSGTRATWKQSFSTHRPATISKFRMQISVWYGLRETKG